MYVLHITSLFKFRGKPDVISRLVHVSTSCSTVVIFTDEAILSQSYRLHKNLPLLPVFFIWFNSVRMRMKGFNSGDFVVMRPVLLLQWDVMVYFFLLEKGFFGLKSLQVSYWFLFIWTLLLCLNKSRKNTGGGIMVIKKPKQPNQKTNQLFELTSPSQLFTNPNKITY